MYFPRRHRTSKNISTHNLLIRHAAFSNPRSQPLLGEAQCSRMSVACSSSRCPHRGRRRNPDMAAANAIGSQHAKNRTHDEEFAANKGIFPGSFPENPGNPGPIDVHSRSLTTDSSLLLSEWPDALPSHHALAYAATHNGKLPNEPNNLLKTLNQPPVGSWEPKPSGTSAPHPLLWQLGESQS